MDKPYLKEAKSYEYSMHVIAIAMEINDVAPDIPAKYTGSCNLWNYNYCNSCNKLTKKNDVFMQKQCIPPQSIGTCREYGNTTNI